MKLEADVIVVGGGPAGLALACELRLAGLDVLVLERRAECVSNLPGMGMHGGRWLYLGLRDDAPAGVDVPGSLQTVRARLASRCRAWTAQPRCWCGRMATPATRRPDRKSSGRLWSIRNPAYIIRASIP
jgi:choline dehydrogenase-like flavoprotein